MSEALRWWLMTSVVGLAALPMCLTLFRRLPDRGYALSKPFALLLVGYVFWIVVILGLPNSTRVIVFVLALFFAASALFLWRSRKEFLDFVRDRWWLIATTEAIFFLAFVTAAYLRSFVPDLGGTEKPMDFMFINALTRAESFPPQDVWLAGEDVSYYYFGYLIVSVMSRLSDVGTAIGYNLGLAMIVGLAVTAVFGLVYNLAAPKAEAEAAGEPGTPDGGFSSHVLWRPMVFGAAGALLLTVMGNLEGLLEALAAHNFLSSGFWDWVGINELFAYDSTRWFPDQFWFWWRATRIIQPSEGLIGIHEFPFFSFLLGDLHPHVMSIPFVLLAIGVALALLRSDTPLDVVVWLERPLSLVAIGLILGGLAFLNTWDMPTFAFVIALVTVLRNRLMAERWSWGLLSDSAGFLAPLFLVSFLAYTPFFFGGFDSQAAGFTADAREGSRLFHTFLIWGAFAVLVLPYAIWRIARGNERLTGSAILRSLAPFAAVLLLWFAWDAFGLNAEELARGETGFARDSLLGWLPANLRPNDGALGLWDRIGERGWSGWFSILAIGGSLSLLTLALGREVSAAKHSAQERLSHVMALALCVTSALLILGAELIFIQDGFNSRMNTIFKLYYQAWLMLSVAGGFVLYELASSLSLPKLTAREERSTPLAIAGWSLGEYGVVAATAAGAIVGVIVMRSNTSTDLLTVALGVLFGSGAFFVLSGAALMLWRSSTRVFAIGASLAGVIAGLLISGFQLDFSFWNAVFGGVIGAFAFLLASVAAVQIGRAISGAGESARGTRALSWRAVWAGGVVVVLSAAFVYPLLATWNRTEGCVAHPVPLLGEPANCGDVYANRSLDGQARLEEDELAAIEFLSDLDGQPVIAEALGDDYTDGGRISASTGLPTLLQWPGHELQWRGSGDAQAGRPEELQLLYTSGDVEQLTGVIEKYDISYVYLGQRERQRYQPIALPAELFEPHFEQGSVIIYRVRAGVQGEVARE